MIDDDDTAGHESVIGLFDGRVYQAWGFGFCVMIG